jgi:SAM-dependent methyltransferase
MPSIEANRRHWESYTWSRGGEEWSAPWGGTENLWRAVLLPRIGRFLGVHAILEIGPGHGRLTAHLVDRCERLFLVDVTPGCIEACQRRFAGERHVEYHIGDGRSLPAVADGSIDFAFSFDSLVHADHEAMSGYLAELDRVLAPRGVAFLHHSNLAAYRDPATRRCLVANRHWRASDVSADSVVATAARTGCLRCVRQELIAWEGGSVLTDCLSCLVHPQHPLAGTPVRRAHPAFFELVRDDSALRALYL